MALIICCECRREVPERAEVCPHCGAEPVKVRSVLAIVAFAAVGLVVGTLIAAILLAMRRAAADVGTVSAADAILGGSMWGTVAGTCAGALFWAFSPYKPGSRIPAPVSDAPPCDSLEGCDGLPD